MKSSDAPKGRFEREFPTISRVSRLAKLSQFDQMYDFSGFSHQHAKVVAEDKRHGNSHQKVVQMIFSSNVYRSMCVQYNQTWFMKGISAEHWHCVFSLEIWGWHWYWVPGKNKEKSITRFDSLDRDRLDFLGWERLWKVEESNDREPLRDGHVQSDLQNLLHYIRY